MAKPTPPAPPSDETVELLRRMREVLSDYHTTLLAIATQSNGTAARAARRTIERHSGGRSGSRD